MRRLWLVLPIMAVACGRQPASQPPENAAHKTAIEVLLDERGTLLVKEEYPLGEITGTGTLYPFAVTIYESNGARKAKGLRVEVKEPGGPGRSKESFIDLDEFENLSHALASMADLSSQWAANPHSPRAEAVYSSKGELQIGVYQIGTEIRAFCESGGTGPVSIFFETREIPKLKLLIDRAATVLKEN